MTTILRDIKQTLHSQILWTGYNGAAGSDPPCGRLKGCGWEPPGSSLTHHLMADAGSHWRSQLRLLPEHFCPFYVAWASSQHGSWVPGETSQEGPRWKPHHPWWPSPGSSVVIILPHSISWNHLKVLPRFKGRSNRLCHWCRWQCFGRAYGTSNLVVPFLEKIICHSIWAVYKFIGRGAPRMF